MENGKWEIGLMLVLNKPLRGLGSPVKLRTLLEKQKTEKWKMENRNKGIMLVLNKPLRGLG